MLDKIESLKEQVNKLHPDPRGRRKYPPAIRKTICEMIDDGAAMNELARATGIHVATLHYWHQPKKKKERKPGFSEVKVTMAPAITPPPRTSEIQIQFASGAQVFGLGVADLIELLKRGCVL